jgi:hypothetical protein
MMTVTMIRLALVGFLGFMPFSAYGYYWGTSTSEEYPPSACRSSGDFVSGFRCSGSHCDNVRVECDATGLPVRSRIWTRQISEEDVSSGVCMNVSDGSVRCNNYLQICAETAFITGVSCSGRYCDNLSLECTYLTNFVRTGCYWTHWVSEENGGTILFPGGYYANGMECSGGYCDNKRFYICQARPF